MAEHIKSHKIQVYYVVSEIVCNKPRIENSFKHYIHSEQSNGFWASVRDMSQSEIIANSSVNKKINIELRICNNKRILENDYKKLLIEFRGKTYKLVNEVDQYFYENNDLTLRAALFEDTGTFTKAAEYE